MQWIAQPPPPPPSAWDLPDRAPTPSSGTRACARAPAQTSPQPHPRPQPRVAGRLLRPRALGSSFLAGPLSSSPLSWILAGRAGAGAWEARAPPGEALGDGTTSRSRVARPPQQTSPRRLAPRHNNSPHRPTARERPDVHNRWNVSPLDGASGTGQTSNSRPGWIAPPAKGNLQQSPTRTCDAKQASKLLQKQYAGGGR